MQPLMSSHSFSYSWFMAGGNPALLGLLLLHCGYYPDSPPHVSLFASCQAAHLITRAGKGKAASLDTLHSPSVTLQRTQKQRSERDSKKKTFWKALKGESLSSPHAVPARASPSPFPAHDSHRHCQQLTATQGKGHKSFVSANSNTAAVVDFVSPLLSACPLFRRDHGAASWDGERQRPALGSSTARKQVIVVLISKRGFSPPRTYYQEKRLRYCKDIYAYPFEPLNLTVWMLRFGFVLCDALRRALCSLYPGMVMDLPTLPSLAWQPYHGWH